MKKKAKSLSNIYLPVNTHMPRIDTNQTQTQLIQVDKLFDSTAFSSAASVPI